jgi:protein-L-isoaspartate O-methyltransferase
VGAAGGAQDLLLIVKGADGRIERKSVLPVRFVPLVPGK